MPAPAPSHWFSLTELADMRLPGLPRTKNKLAAQADRERWGCQQDEAGQPLVRRRKGKGGGFEYNIQVLRLEARQALAKKLPRASYPHTANDQPIDPSSAWAVYDRQSNAAKAKAERRLKILLEIERQIEFGSLVDAAVETASGVWGESKSTIYGWRARVAGIRQSDWLPALAPNYKGGGVKSPIPDEVFTYYLSEVARPKVGWETAYSRTKKFAKSRGISIPCAQTFKRRVRDTVTPEELILLREGVDALLAKARTPVSRSVAALHAMEWVNIDGHKCDVFVRWPDGSVSRPIFVAIQDLWSRAILAWRIDKSENVNVVKLVWSDLFAKYGIPRGVTSDNGMSFASKVMTAGQPTRYRGKVNPDEAFGLLPGLGIHINWALPGHGQSKPIERAFGEITRETATMAEFDGAFVGHDPLDKPFNYETGKAVEFDVFMRVWAQGVADYNARKNRRTEATLKGESFYDAFKRSYESSIIPKMPAEQLRQWILPRSVKKVAAPQGILTLNGNKYWCIELLGLVGKSVIVRQDEDDPTTPVHVYDLTDRYLFDAPPIRIVNFLDPKAAKEIAREKRELRKRVRDGIAARGILEAKKLAEIHATFDDAPEELPPSPAATRMARPRVRSSAAAKLAPQEFDPIPTGQNDFIGNFTKGAARLRSVTD